MTDEELKRIQEARQLQLEFSREDLARMCVASYRENDRLRAENRRLVEACSLALRRCDGEAYVSRTMVVAALRAAIEKE